MPRITKKELWARVKGWPHIPGDPRAAATEMMASTARALGYEVVEELELPDSLQLQPFGEPAGREASVVWINFKTGAIECAPELRPLLVEVAVRYNAKEAVLEIADELEHFRIEPDVHAKPVAERLRAAYKVPGTQQDRDANR